MTLTQQTFLGASIRYFNCSVGWGTQTSTFEAGLIEDHRNGDDFNPPDIGAPAYFDYDGWKFGGILKSYNRQYDQGGAPVISVQLEDPRELLDGVKLILQDYSGPTYNVPNLYNIYGYLETVYGFGGSQSNDSGIPWTLIRDALYQLQLTTPIYFRGHYYICAPFIGGDIIPSYYRIGSECISILDFINDVCSAAVCDYHVSLYEWSNPLSIATNFISVNLVNRRTPPQLGKIDEFVSSVAGAVSKRQGYELQNETTSKFVIGGKLNNLYFQEQANTGNNKPKKRDTYYDDVISPFWGYDCYDNLIIGVGDFNGPTGKEYQFNIDGRPIYIQTGIPFLINYPTDLAEMRAANAGLEAWEAFLWFFNDVEGSIHKGKAEILGLTGSLNRELMAALSDAKKTGVLPPVTRAISASAIERVNILNSHALHEKQQKLNEKIYNFVNTYASEYYGKKFMVRIPFVLGKVTPETNEIVLSLEPTATAYLEEAQWSSAYQAGYLPYNPEKFTDADNKIYSYARFSRMQPTEDEDGNPVDIKCRYGLERLSLDSFILDQYPNLSLGEMRENLFVKCTINPKLVFLNKYTLFSPRVVIELDAPISDNLDYDRVFNSALLDELKIFLTDETSVLTEAQVDEYITKQSAVGGGELFWKAKDANLQIPDMVAVTLQSNILTYGPWYASGKEGKVEFEKDESLVPWNYGGFDNMNLAGWSRVNDAYTGQQVNETGTVEFPGVPSIQLGNELLTSGPIITDINVNVSDGGVTTTYNMATWSYQFGTLGKYNVDRLSRFSQTIQKQRKAFRQLFGYKDPLYITAIEQDYGQTIEKTEGASSTLFMGDVIVEGSGNTLTVKTSVTTGSSKTMISTLDDDSYATKAGMSFDGMFAPYTTHPGSSDYSSHLPRFESPAEGASSPTSVDLNPYGDGGIAFAMPESEKIPDNMSTEITNYDGDVKGIGLKAPVVVTGWGYDTNGNPVPTGVDGGFITNYKKRADLWKTGPLDIRWDDTRKVWSAGGGTSSSVEIGTLGGYLMPSGTTTATMYDGVVRVVHDCLLPENRFLPPKSKVVVASAYGNYYVIAAQPRC